MTHTLLDRVLPTWDVAECHAIDVAATSEVVYAAVLAYRPDRGRLFRLLMALRAAPARLRVGGRGPGWARTPRSAEGFVAWAEGFGFSLLGESPGREIVFGLVGQFWRPGGGLAAAPAHVDAFAAFETPGYVLAAWGFWVEGLAGERCRLVTETQVRATDAVSRRRVARYWWLIRPFSGLVRREALLAIGRAAGSARPARAG